MKTRILYCIAALVLVVGLTISANASMVSHGKCVSFDEAKNILVIEEYDLKTTPENKFGQPTGKQSTYDCADAMSKRMVGPTPRPGDIIRIAYEEKGGQKIAIRVMNVTRTDIMKK
jgi:hypothetical protein